MADYGSEFAIAIPVWFTGDNHVATTSGVPQGYADFVFDADPELADQYPNIGQIWPRGNVGVYKGEARGSIYIVNIVRYVPPPSNKLGQLWPRGDYIPSRPNKA